MCTIKSMPRRGYMKILMYNCNNINPAAFVIGNTTSTGFRGICSRTAVLLFSVSYYNATGLDKNNTFALPCFVPACIGKEARFIQTATVSEPAVFRTTVKRKYGVQTVDVHLQSASLLWVHWICQSSHFQSQLLPIAIIILTGRMGHMGKRGRTSNLKMQRKVRPMLHF